MFQQLVLWLSRLWRWFKGLLVAPMELGVQSVVQPRRFAVRVTYRTPTVGGGQLYVRVVDDAEEGRFITVEALSGGRGELIIPVDSLHIPDGRRYRFQIVHGNGSIHRRSPTVWLNVPAYPQLGGGGQAL